MPLTWSQSFALNKTTKYNPGCYIWLPELTGSYIWGLSLGSRLLFNFGTPHGGGGWVPAHSGGPKMAQMAGKWRSRKIFGPI
jgi:hypothetical protein